MADPSVRIEGFKEFRRDLRKIAPEVSRELTRDIRRSVAPVLATARQLAPKGTRPIPSSRRPQVRLANSLRVSVTNRGVLIRSPLPQAGVLHWGGSIAPKGVTIRFPRTEFLTLALQRNANLIEKAAGDTIDRAIIRAGWR